MHLFEYIINLSLTILSYCIVTNILNLYNKMFSFTLSTFLVRYFSSYKKFTLLINNNNTSSTKIYGFYQGKFLKLF